MDDALAALAARHNPKAGRSTIGRVQAWVGRNLSRLSALVPSDRKAEDAATQIFRLLLTSHALTEFIALYRPKFAIRLLALDVYGVQQFSDALMTALISAPQSELYKEIKESQNLAGCGYALPKHNEILHYLFADANIANRLAVWRPVGEHLIAELRASRNPHYISFLNGPAEHFNEAEKWSDTTFVGIRFFDLMVTAAACQDIQWHMWLYYYPHFLRRIVAIYDDSGDDIDRTDEWPTRASYLMYVLFDTLLEWVKIARKLPGNSSQLQIGNDRPEHQNNNIPKSAAIALGSCFGILLQADNVGKEFRLYILDLVLRRIRDFETKGVEGRLRKILINSIIERGPLGPEAGYGERLSALWEEIDHILRIDLKDFQTALRTAYP